MTRPPFQSSSSRSPATLCRKPAIFDSANNIIRSELATIPGAAIPYPYGGKQRQVQVDLDAQALRSKGLSGTDVVAAIASQNLILPAGTQKIGDLEYYIGINASPEKIEQMNDLPISSSNGRRGVRSGCRSCPRRLPAPDEHCTDGGPAGRADDHPEARQSLHSRCHQRHQGETPAGAECGPVGLKIQPIGDQSVFVKASISGVIREATIAAALTGLMILLFLGSWRSTLIIFISIPLFDPGLDRLPGRSGRDDQHHDPGRPRARGRHSGG